MNTVFPMSAWMDLKDPSFKESSGFLHVCAGKDEDIGCFIDSKELQQEGTECTKVHRPTSKPWSPATKASSLPGSPTTNAQPSQKSTAVSVWTGISSQQSAGVVFLFILQSFPNSFWPQKSFALEFSLWPLDLHLNTSRKTQKHAYRGKPQELNLVHLLSSHTSSRWPQILLHSNTPSRAPTWIFSPAVLNELNSVLLLSPPEGVPTSLAVSLLSSAFLSPALHQSSLALS